MHIVSNKSGWWLVWEVHGEEHSDGPFPDYQSVKAARDECERADAEDAAQQLEK